MKFNRIGRILVCLVLICALVVNISPIKAQAAVPMSAMLIPVGMAIISWLIGLGVQAIQDNPEPFQGVVNAAASALDAAGYVVNGMVALYNFGNGAFYCKREIGDFLHNWVFEQQIVYSSSGPGISYPNNAAANSAIYNASLQPYAALVDFGDGCQVVWSASELVFTLRSDGDYQITAKDGSNLNVWRSNTGWINPSWHVFDSDYPIIHFGTMDPCYVADGLFLGHIASPDDGLADGYPNWVPTAVTIDGIETQMYPLGLGQTEEETQGFTQEQIWSGESTYIQDEIQDTAQQQITVQGLDTHFYELGTKLAQWFSDLTTGVTSIPQQILDGLGQILIDVFSYLFVPRQEFLQAKVQALTQEFAFADSIVNTGKAIITGLSGITTEPPVIYIDLGANRGSHYLGGKVPFLDLRWYAEYKATVDTLISAFLWICFVWRMLLKLPGIIGGMPGDFVYGAAHTLGLDSHLPTRNAAYEVTRAANREYIRKGPGK